MSIIIRLQNLPWSANAQDIRHFFNGLGIPEGGVHIVGGELGDAFIAFSMDEDARQALNRTNGKIKGIQIKLMLSSRQEMQRVIEQARNQGMAAFMLNSQVPTPLPAAVPQVIPSAIPDLRQDKDKDSDRGDKKKDKKRSRSRSRSRDKDKRDRSRDKKDRKHRDRSRSRSRDRRERRRRDRSRSRNRSRSRDRDSRRRDRSPKRDRLEQDPSQAAQLRKSLPEVWANHLNSVNPAAAAAAAAALNLIPPVNDAPNLLGTFGLDATAKRTLVENLAANLQSGNLNVLPANNPISLLTRGRESWPPVNSLLHGNAPPHSDIVPRNSGRGGHSGRNFIRSDNDSLFPPRNSHFNGRKNRYGNNEEFEKPVNACISLEPFYGSYADLRRFFNGLTISYRGIKILADDNGHKTGACYVQFRDANMKNEALQLSGLRLNNSEVVIKHVPDKVYDEASDRARSRAIDDNGEEGFNKFPRHKNISRYFHDSMQEIDLEEFTCLRLEDLPGYAKEQDILHIFSQYSLVSMHLSQRPRGGSVAYVKFSSKEDAKSALDDKLQHIIGRKVITVIPCTEEEFDQVNNDSEENSNDSSVIIKSDCVKILKLPLTTGERDISDFFSDIGVKPSKIHLVMSTIGFTGCAFCEFETMEDAVKALSKNDTMFGQTNVTVVPVKRSEMEAVMANGLLNGDDAQLENNLRSSASPPLSPTGSAEANNQLDNERMQSGQFPNSMNMLQQQQMYSNVRPSLGGRYGGRGNDHSGGYGFPRSRGGRYGGRGRGGPRFNNHYNNQNNEDPGEDVPVGCTVYMDNVPYKAGTEQILDFFEGYNCTNNVSRRYNPNNTPSAEARVTFHNAEDAYKAVKELNGRKIWERSIYLKQA